MIEHKILNIPETCTGCFACSNICPKNAIEMKENFEGFLMPVIDSDKCINCGLCDKICPIINDPGTSTMKKAYYAKANDEIRKSSSSGGVFHVLSQKILSSGGIVYGAAFNYGDQVRLECHSTRDVSLEALKRSKYVQNYIGNAFRDIEKDLKNGLQVLYCGTPCQVAGLKSFLRKDYENLLTVDFVCHGVPSLDMLSKHLKYLGIKNVVDINFRPKNRSWVDDLEIRYKKNPQSNRIKLCRIPRIFDEYFDIFQKYQNIRRSCRNCQFCNGQRCSDITIADFWGVFNYDSSLYDPKGLSLILPNTSKGEIAIKFMDDLSDFFIQEIPTKYAEYAYARIRTAPDSPYQSEMRDHFLRDVYSIGYKDALKKNGMMPKRTAVLKYRCKSIIKKLIRKK